MIDPIPILGKLESLEIYEFYDEPVLFACKNAAGQIFLTVLKDETDHSKTWLYVALSPARFEAVRSGNIDLHAAFAEPEDGIAYLVEAEPKRRPDVKVIQAAELLDEDLPVRGETLDVSR